MTSAGTVPRRDPALRPVTKRYRARQAAARRALSAEVDTAWSAFDLSAPLSSLSGIGRSVGVWTVAGQQVAEEEALAYLAALVAAKHEIGAAEVAPFVPVQDLAGQAASGATVQDLTGAAPRVFLQAKARTGEDELAEASVRAFLASVARSEPTRVANLTVLTNAQSDPRMTGRFYRVTEARACAFCRSIADRGYSQASAGFLAHRNCGCTAEPEPAFHVSARGRVLRPVLHRAG